MLEEIIKELKTPSGERRAIPQSEVRRWMETTEPDTLGAVYVFLSKPDHISRVSPPLSFDPVFDFMLRYYEFCLTTNPQSKWANSAYSAGSDLVGWFVWMWDEGRDRRYLEIVKSLLARLYISGPSDLKTCIEHAVIEHLFERKPIRRFFGDWNDNPELRPAYAEGMAWIKSGGASPLTDRS